MTSNRFLWIGLLSLLTACSPSQSFSLPALLTDISTIQTPTVATYSIAPTGHVTSFEGFKEPKASYDIPDGKDQFGLSYILQAPIRITPDNFYPNTPLDNASDLSNYTYGKIQDRLLFRDDPSAVLSYEKTADGFAFSVSRVSKTITFYHVMTDPANDYSSNVKIYSRFAISLTYSQEGLLMEESIQSTDVTNPDQSLTVDCQAVYQYTEA